MFFRQIAQGRVDIKPEMLSNGTQHLEVIHAAAVPATDRPFTYGQGVIMDDPLRVKVLFNAETVAAWAGTGRVVKGEQTRFQLGNAVTTVRTGELGGKQQLGVFAVIVHRSDVHQTVTQLKADFNRLRQTLLNAFFNLETVHHHFNGVFTALVEGWCVIQITHQTVDPGADKAL